MALAPGTRLGQYSILALIGSGGMGEVYRARDTRLGRDVAIKVLPAPFAGDHERLARFEREAQLLASLNHPHIAHIHGLEESDGVRALVMELVEGETLAERIARGAIPVADVLSIADQVAEALQFAHDHGVVHRDLKPANVKLTADGAVKVLDFGLAKAIGGDASGEVMADASHSPTISIGSTRAGLILGTAAYMSPEQARGRAVDKRTDIWAFGCLVYECLTARKAFEGETVSDTISLILQREPDWSALPAGTPAGVRRLLARCLEKDAKKRLRDIGDARIEIEDAVTGKSTADAPARRWSRRASTVAGIVLMSLAAAGGYVVRDHRALVTSNNSALAPTLRLSVNTPPGIRVQGAELSPDGNYVVFMGGPPDETTKRLYARRLDSFDIQPIAGTDGVTVFTFSIDGKRIAFVAPASGQGGENQLARVPIDGSAPAVTITMMKDEWSYPCWLPNGDLLVSHDDGKGYVRIPAHGGAPVEHTLHRGMVTAFFNWSEVLPDGKGCLIRLTGWQNDGFHIDTAVLNLENDSLRVLVQDAGGAEYSSTGNIVFARNDVLFAAPFDMAAQKVTGEPVALFNGLRTNNSWGDGAFYLSDNGTLMYPPGGRTGSNRRLVWIDDGGTKPVADEQREFEELSVRDDGARVVVTLSNARGVFGLWMGEGAGLQFRPFQSFPGADCSESVWSPDGRRIAFVRRGQTRDDGLYVMNSDGHGAPVRIVASVYDSVTYDPWCWSADSKSVLATTSSSHTGKQSVAAIPVDGSGPVMPLDLGPGDVFGPAASSDGRYLAFSSDVTGRSEIYVAEMGNSGSAGTAVRVSQSGVVGPTNGLGRFGFRGPGQVYFVDRQNRLMLSTLTTRPSLAASLPVVMADLHALRIDPLRIAALSDGRIMAIQNGEDEDDVTSYNVVTNWSDILRAKMAAH